MPRPLKPSAVTQGLVDVRSVGPLEILRSYGPIVVRLLLSFCRKWSLEGKKEPRRILLLRAEPLAFCLLIDLLEQLLGREGFQVWALEEFLYVGDYQDPEASLLLYLSEKREAALMVCELDDDSWMSPSCPLYGREGTFDLVYLSLDGINGDRFTVGHWTRRYLAGYLRPDGFGLLHIPIGCPLSVVHNDIDPVLRELADFKGRVFVDKSQAASLEELQDVLFECGLSSRGWDSRLERPALEKPEELVAWIRHLISPLDVDPAELLKRIQKEEPNDICLIGASRVYYQLSFLTK